MYDTLAMIKPDASFTNDDLQRVLLAVTRSGSETVAQTGTGFQIHLGQALLRINRGDEPHVVAESDEITKQFGSPCRGCRSRLEMAGDDPNMDLFNTYLLLNERLQDTGKFVIFDTQQMSLPLERPT